MLTERELEALDYGYRERVTELHLPHDPRAAAHAARRSSPRPRAAPATAGFDGVELHYAHAYTMASFLSRLNTRDDGYGGRREDRVRLPLEVLRAVRRAVGRDFVVGIRFLGDEVIEGGNRLEDAAWFGVRFAEAGVDFLSVSKGGKFEDAKQPKVGEAVYPYTGRSGYECMPTVISDARGPFGRNVPLAAAIRARRARRRPRHAGRHHRRHLRLRAGRGDPRRAARPTSSPPRARPWPIPTGSARSASAAAHVVRRCEFTNYCEGLDQQHKQVTCKLWDREGLDEPDVRLASDGKRRLGPPSWQPPTQACTP